jgi:hypothetical protein
VRAVSEIEPYPSNAEHSPTGRLACDLQHQVLKDVQLLHQRGVLQEVRVDQGDPRLHDLDDPSMMVERSSPLGDNVDHLRNARGSERRVAFGEWRPAWICTS